MSPFLAVTFGSYGIELTTAVSHCVTGGTTNILIDANRKYSASEGRRVILTLLRHMEWIIGQIIVQRGELLQPSLLPLPSPPPAGPDCSAHPALPT
jgi:hypothetical protein